MTWQDSMVVVYQNYMHPLETTVPSGVSSTNYAAGFEFENCLNLMPSRVGRFASAVDPRGSPAGFNAKILRYQFNRTFTVDCVALININSNAIQSMSGDVDIQKEVTVELFHGAGSGGTYPATGYGQGSGSPGTAIGGRHTMSRTLVSKYGSNLFFRFAPVSASILTFRFGHYDNSNVSSLSIGNILAGRYYSFPTDSTLDGWMLIDPTNKKVRKQTGRTSRAFGAVQVESRYQAHRAWMIPTMWRSEALREDFEQYWANRMPPRLDGLQNQHFRKRLDIPTAIVMPWQWVTNPGDYGHPTFGMFGDELETEYHSAANATMTRVEFQEIA